MNVEDKINARVIKLFEPALKTIIKQSACEHVWKEKNGAANYRCKKCGYLADDRTLDKLIFKQKLEERGVTQEQIKQLNNLLKDKNNKI